MIFSTSVCGFYLAVNVVILQVTVLYS